MAEFDMQVRTPVRKRGFSLDSRYRSRSACGGLDFPQLRHHRRDDDPAFLGLLAHHAEMTGRPGLPAPTPTPYPSLDRTLTPYDRPLVGVI
jgi:hypothetical protein